jgi:hypothetical protein
MGVWRQITERVGLFQLKATFLPAEFELVWGRIGVILPKAQDSRLAAPPYSEL